MSSDVRIFENTLCRMLPSFRYPLPSVSSSPEMKSRLRLLWRNSTFVSYSSIVTVCGTDGCSSTLRVVFAFFSPAIYRVPNVSTSGASGSFLSFSSFLPSKTAPSSTFATLGSASSISLARRDALCPRLLRIYRLLTARVNATYSRLRLSTTFWLFSML